MRTRLLKSQRGQSLLEIAVSLGLVALIITILTITTINGLRNSQFAKNQVLASSYAQQGVELVKVMRQKDCPIRITNGNLTFKWYNNSGGQSLIWDVNEPAFVVGNSNIFIATSTPSTCEIAQSPIGESLDNGIFTRTTTLERVVIPPSTTATVRVTVIVGWTDFSGPHQVTNVSLLTNY